MRNRFIVALILICSASGVSPSSGRDLTVDDVLRMEDVGRVLFAGHDRYVVFERIPPYEHAPNIAGLFSVSDRSALAHILSIDRESSELPRPLFTQETDAGYWIGGISPDESKLAVYSQSKGSTRAGVYDFDSKNLRWFSFTPNYSWLFQSPIWLSNSTMVYSTLPAGEQPPAIQFRNGIASRLEQLWQKSFDGSEHSSTEMVSSKDGEHNANSFRRGSLVKVDVTTGAEVTIGDGHFYNLRLSPNGLYLSALKEAGGIQPSPHIPTADSFSDGTRKQLVIFPTAGRENAIKPCEECDVQFGTVEWSDDGTSLTFFARLIHQSWKDGHYYRFGLRDKKLTRLQFNGLQSACSRVWTHAHRIFEVGRVVMAFARRKDTRPAVPFFSAERCGQSGRFDWFAIQPDGSMVNVTSSFQSVSGEPVGKTDGAVFIFGDGAIWRLDGSGPPQRVTSESRPELRPWDKGMEPATFSEETRSLGPTLSDRAILVGASTIVRVDLRQGAETIQQVLPEAKLLALSDSDLMSILRHDTAQGSQILFLPGDGSRNTILELNTHLEDVSTGRQVHISYELLGKRISSCALLPASESRTKPYPTIVYVYPGTPDACQFVSTGQFNRFNMQLLTAQGYAVLFANTPKDLIASQDGSTRKITAAVLAATQQMIDEGVADPDRLGLFGFSQGYHSVLQIVTETHRFRAAVALNGTSDFVSEYGAMPLFTRILPFGNVGIGDTARFESRKSDNYLGAKLWENPRRYILNSPVFYADRIETPLLLMDSDFDGFPLGQSGEIFSALYRQRKDATYVTYWGEGHGPLSPANIRDMWHRIFSWYGKHLGPATAQPLDNRRNGPVD